MLPERMMRDPAALRTWIARAFKTAARLPPKTGKTGKSAKPAKAAKAKPRRRKLRLAVS